MFLATVSKPRQLLATRYIQEVNRADLTRALVEVKELLTCLSPGFTVLVDLSQLTGMDSDCAAEIGLLMEDFTRAGVGRVIRLIPDVTKDIGFNILGVFHYPNDLPIMNCQSFKEVVQLLEP